MVAYKQCRVLVVEDETWVAMDLEAILADLGCEVVGPVANVPHALHLIETKPIDSAILDLNVNGTMSYGVADALANANIPFLILTGHEREYLPERLRSKGFLQKPFGTAELLREFAGVMDDGSRCAELLRSA